MVKTLVWPVVLYGCETWTMRKDVVNKLKAFEMWAWRRMEKVNWKDKKTNEEILISVGEERSFVPAVTKRKKNWIGHVLRENSLLELMIEERRVGKKVRGRPRMGMIDDLKVLHDNEKKGW